jgi:cyclin B
MLSTTEEQNNPQLVLEYQKEIYSYLRKNELSYLPKYPYMKGFQTDINDKMRSILMDWLVDVHLKFKLVPETLFLSVNLIDRYLEKNIINRTKLQLIGVTAMLIACKYEEIYAPEVRDFVYITDQAYTKEEILSMENNMLRSLEFNVTTPSSYRFLEIFKNFLKLDEMLFMFCRYLLEILLVDPKTNKFNPSLLAASAIYITLKITKKNEIDMITKISDYTEDKLRECAKDICLILDNEEKNNLKAVKKKFSSIKYLEVSKIKFF